MSVNWLAKAWEAQVGSVSRKAVLIALADRCGEDGVCWPSHRDIVTRTELGLTAVKEALIDLEVDGFIRTSKRRRPNGANTSKSYQLTISSNTRTPSRQPTGVVREPTTPQSGADYQEPSLEPSVNRSTASSRSDAAQKRKLSIVREPDDSTRVRGEEPPPARRSPAAKKTPPERYKSPEYKLTEYFEELLAAAGLPVSVYKAALARQLKTIIDREGYTLDELRSMVELFVSSNDRYVSGDKAMWQHFLTARERLKADSTKKTRAKAPAKELYGKFDPYAENA